MNHSFAESERFATNHRFTLPEPPHSASPGSEPPNHLTNLWENLIRGQLRPLHEGTTLDSVRFIAQITPGSALSPDEALLVRSVLCGAARKVLAPDFGIAVSTTTGRYRRALAKLDFTDCTMPLVLVLAAQSRATQARIPSAPMTYVDHKGLRCLSFSVPRPVMTHLAELTPGQQQVAQWLIEGGTRETIAERRCTAVNTVAGQVHAIFHALRVTGRYALIRKASELGCFGQPVMSVA
jgi:DNA-binding CsgD family transcriptional regulator